METDCGMRVDRYDERISIANYFSFELDLREGVEPTWTATREGIRICSWRDEWEKIYDAEGFRKRDFFVTVTANHRMIAAAVLTECASLPDHSPSLTLFWYAADTIDHKTYQAAEALFSSFCRAE